MNLLLSPHSDDESLFASFSIIRHMPVVVICFGSSGDYGDTETRLQESRAAVQILGGIRVEQWDGQDLQSKMHDIDDRLSPTRVFAPSAVTSHRDHVAVAVAAAAVFGDRLTRYHTYNIEDSRAATVEALGKVRIGNPVPFETKWLSRKRAALTCYKTQLAHPRACRFFEMDLAEYVEP